MCLVLFSSALSARADKAPPPPAPLDPGLSERAESRLVQFELRVSRKGVPVGGLHADDFDIELGGKPLTAFTMDDMCASEAAAESAPAARPGSFIFYFDDSELTLEGRVRAIEVARLAAASLLAHGHDLLIYRNTNVLRTETKWTHDAAEVSAALDRIAADPGHKDYLPAAMNELQAERLIDRAQELVHQSNMQFSDAMFDAYSQHANDRTHGSGGGGMSSKIAPPANPHGGYNGAVQNAFSDALAYDGSGNAVIADLVSQFRTLVQDELVKNERDIERLRDAVRSLSLRPSPKGLVYFSDTLRRDPGGVITRLVGSDSTFTGRGSDVRGGTSMPSWTSDEELTALVRDASTYGVRFYAVEGRGMAAPSDWVRSAQDTIAGLALDTGGHSFLNGRSARSIADSIAADQACWYLVSFDPSGWDTDRTLGLDVWSKKPGLRVLTLSSLIVPSPTMITQARLLAAHMGGDSLNDNPLSVSIYPVGGTSQQLKVLAQVRMPTSGMPPAIDTTWDVGFDVVSGGAVVAHNSGRVAWRGNGEPPVYQTTLSLPTGPYEIVAVAREDTTDAIRSGRVSGRWPASSADGVTLSLPVVAQPQRGGLVVDGKVKATGIVVRDAGNPVDSRASLAFVTAACISAPAGTHLRAERSVVGETEVKFDSTTLKADEGRCAQIRDLVAAGTFGAGRFTYYVQILSGDTVVSSQELSFDVAAKAAPPPSPPPQ